MSLARTADPDRASLLSRMHWTGSFASAGIAAVIVTMAAIALAIGEFEFDF